PRSRGEIVHHRIIHQKGPQVPEDGTQRALQMDDIEGLVALRTNASLTHLRAVELGMGIGGVATYLAAMGIDLVPIDADIRSHVDIWMTYHPDARSTPRVSVFIDWLKTLFDPKQY